MPRTARIKNETYIYHVMARSISDVILFKSTDDKLYYLKLIKKYKDIFDFRVYAYCIMDNHIHIIIDCCGADISKIMHSINQCYAQYYNRKYNRHGHLFQDRFKSKIVFNDRYLQNVTGYIHNNPSDIKEYKNNVQKYSFSSLGIYLGIKADTLDLVDTGFVLQLLSQYKTDTNIKYLKFVSTCNEEILKEEYEQSTETSLCVSKRKIINRTVNPMTILNYLKEYIKTTTTLKNELKSISILLLRRFCNLGFNEICSLIGGISPSYTSKLCIDGANLIANKQQYKELLIKIVALVTII